MADGTLDSQVGARICNGLGIMRACLETQKREQLEARIDEITNRLARTRTDGARTLDAQRPSDSDDEAEAHSGCSPRSRTPSRGRGNNRPAQPARALLEPLGERQHQLR